MEIDATVIIVAGIAAFGSISAACISALAVYRTGKTHDLVNSRMSELLALTKEYYTARGVIEGKEIQANRDAEVAGRVRVNK